MDAYPCLATGREGEEHVSNWNPATDPAIRRLKHELRRIGVPGIALDVDEVQLDITRTRFEEMATLHGTPANVTWDELRYQYRYIEDVPHWQNPAARATADGWRDSVIAHTNLPALPGAVASARRLHRLVPVYAHITNRPGTMAGVTAADLQSHGFPDAQVICRPDGVASDPKWKAAVLRYLSPYVIGIVDDRPDFVSELPAGYPGSIYVFGRFATQTDTSHPAVRVTPTWDDVIKTVSAELPQNRATLAAHQLG